MMEKYFLIVFSTLLCYVASAQTFCGGSTSFTGDSGTIKLSGYEPNANCKYTIELSDKSKWIRLQWVSLKVDGDMPDCKKDYVEVSTGCLVKRVVGRFCSNNLVKVPHDIISPEGCMEIELRASNTESQFVKSSLGFELSYESGAGQYDKTTSTCKATNTIYGSRGVITSPRWPQPYDNINFPNRQCQWQIYAGSDETIQFNIMDLTLPDSGSSTFPITCPAVPYIELAGKKYCSKALVATLPTRFEDALVTMKVKSADETNSNRGMALGYLTYKSSSQKISVQWGLMIVGFMAVLFFRH